jgi:hypothetical protein
MTKPKPGKAPRRGNARRGATPPTNPDRLLPPDPKAPERPTVPGPHCGTLPPVLPSLPGSSGGSRRLGR